MPTPTSHPSAGTGGLNLTKTVQERNTSPPKIDFFVSSYCGGDLVKYPQQHSDHSGFVLPGSYLNFDFPSAAAILCSPAHSTSSRQDRISDFSLHQRQRSSKNSSLFSLTSLLLRISNR
ncbi:uncharacterized protein Bfra_000040 [Botrytis fragariae]|uniref:Uncharacterized protein n=1 Tax=Botrytis fragariae TaxID=1964551 RepID=A0A8H6EMP1_9HELO|nr:uncharacterized protein Bfra_000040 [Botrytis fragariae]KAF5877878.1 hypothetical protein Bfra_000040 [Botrytis fragariae]